MKFSAAFDELVAQPKFNIPPDKHSPDYLRTKRGPKRGRIYFIEINPSPFPSIEEIIQCYL